MTSTLDQQLAIVQKIYNSKSSMLLPKGQREILNDVVNTLASIQLLLSGDLALEFDQFLKATQDNLPSMTTTYGEDLVSFLKQRGLPITK